jgi:hypothetical protein
VRAIEIPCPSCERPAGRRCAIQVSGRAIAGAPEDSAIYCRARVRTASRATGRENFGPDRAARDRVAVAGAARPGQLGPLGGLDRLGRPRRGGARPPTSDFDVVANSADDAPRDGRQSDGRQDDAPDGDVVLAVRVRIDLVVDVRYGCGTVTVPEGDPRAAIQAVARILVPRGARTRPGWSLRAGLTRESMHVARRGLAARAASFPADEAARRRSIRVKVEFVVDLAPGIQQDLPWSDDHQAAVPGIARLLVPSSVHLHDGWFLDVGFTRGSSYAIRRRARARAPRPAAPEESESDRLTRIARERGDELLLPRPMSPAEVRALVERVRWGMHASRRKSLVRTLRREGR